MHCKPLLNTLALAAIAAAPLCAAAQTPEQAQTITTVDREFVQQAMQSHAEEMQTGTIQQNSSDASVRAFAKTIVRDHEASASQLSVIENVLDLAYVGVSDGPTQPGSPRAFMQKEIHDHQREIALYENEVKNGSNETLRTYAGRTLSTLRNHLTMAQQYIAVGDIGPDPAPASCGGPFC